MFLITVRTTRGRRVFWSYVSHTSPVFYFVSLSPVRLPRKLSSALSPHGDRLAAALSEITTSRERASQLLSSLRHTYGRTGKVRSANIYTCSRKGESWENL